MKARTRDNKGATTVALILVLALFVILPLGLLGFEFSRFLLIEQMLRGASNAAALAGSAAMASSDMSQTYANREDWAMYIAGYTFGQNTIMNVPMSAGATNPVTGAPQGCRNIYLYGSNTSFGGPFQNLSADTGATPSTTVPLWRTPTYQQAELNIALVNSSNTMVNDSGDSSNLASQVICIAYYSDRASFSSDILPLGNFTAVSVSRGGLPIIDMDLCFDVSGSMDDESPVFFVNRSWNPTKQQMQWMVANKVAPGISGGAAANSIYNNFTPNVTGSGVNVEPPQNLAAASQQMTGSVPNQSGNKWYPLFSELNVASIGLRSAYCGLRSGYDCSSGTPVAMGPDTYPPLASPSPLSAYEQGLPPGNFDWKNPNTEYGTCGAASPTPENCTFATNANSATPTIFTDLVFDIQTASSVGNPFQTIPWQGFDFSGGKTGTWLKGNTGGTGNAIVLTEAARGNLENTTVMNEAVGYWTPSGTLNPKFASGGIQSPGTYGLAVKSGIYQAYWSYVCNNAQPIGTARVAAYEFFQTMHISANSHFGLICFTDAEANPLNDSSGAGGSLSNAWAPNATYPTDSYPTNNYVYNIDGSYKLGNGGGGGEAYVAGTFLAPGVALDPSNDNWTNGLVQQVCLGSNQGTTDPVCTITGNTVTYMNNSPQEVSGGALQLPPTILPLGYTDMNGVLAVAYNDVKNNSRANATNKAIVLFTDGVPDLPNYTTGASNSITSAGTIGGQGIPIYTIGLATNSTIQQYEDDVLSDNVNHFSGSSAAKGIAWAAANAGAGQSEYFPALTTTLNTAFQAVARSLCVLQ